MDLAFDGLSPKKRLAPSSRSDLPKEDEGVRNLVTFIMAGIVGKQECSKRALCQVGDLITEVKGKALAFMLASNINFTDIYIFIFYKIV